jgi:hypothetical protein
MFYYPNVESALNYILTQEFKKSRQENKNFSILLNDGQSLGKM